MTATIPAWAAIRASKSRQLVRLVGRQFIGKHIRVITSAYLIGDAGSIGRPTDISGVAVIGNAFDMTTLNVGDIQVPMTAPVGQESQLFAVGRPAWEHDVVGAITDLIFIACGDVDDIDIPGAGAIALENDPFGVGRPEGVDIVIGTGGQLAFDTSGGIEDEEMPVTVAVTLIDDTVIGADHGIDIVGIGVGQAGLLVAHIVSGVEFDIAVAVGLEDDEAVIGGAAWARVDAWAFGEIDQLSAIAAFDAIQAIDIQGALAEGVEDDPLRAGI